MRSIARSSYRSMRLLRRRWQRLDRQSTGRQQPPEVQAGQEEEEELRREAKEP